MLALVLLAVTSCVVIVDGKCPKKYARFSTKHTFCLQPNETCTILKTGVSKDARKEILRVHNQLRSKVALGKEEQAGLLPEASNMMEMIWDPELAKIAQKWSSQCNFDHDCNNCRVVEGFRVGQNLALQTVWGCKNTQDRRTERKCKEKAKKPDWKRRINSFYDEVKHFQRHIVPTYQHNAVFGHFAQVIWATSWRVGCGYTVYQDGEYYRQFYACNYGPSGNVKEGAVYKTGKPCTGCPANTCCGNCTKQDPSYTGLCQVVDKKLGPLDESTREGTLLDCNWRRGKPTCSYKVSGKEGWRIKSSIGGGYYYSIKLKGGEKTSLMLTSPINATKASFCLQIVYRKSPEDAAYKDTSVLKAEMIVADFTSKVQLKMSSRTNFVPSSIDLGWNTTTQAGLKISVPKHAPKHIFDLREIVAYDGKCQK